MKVDIIKSTYQVFNECAPIYLKEDKHWGCDLDIISEYAEKFPKPDLIEIGTGYAWHLANLFFVSSAKFGRVVGVDYSEKMLETAKEFLSNISVNGKSLVELIELKRRNILSLRFRQKSFDLALLLNNTLGNIPSTSFKNSKNQRRKVLKKTRDILTDNGYLILTVYNSSKLTEEDKYGNVFELSQKNSNLENFDLIVKFRQTGSHYYSHWFNKEELCKLLYEVSFKIVEIEERRKRIIVVAQKKKN